MQRALILGLLWLCACSRREQSPDALTATATATSPTTSGATPTPPVTPDGDARKNPPTSEAECLSSSCNGKWARHGLAQNESCLCRTNDGGKACKDGAECQGECVLADPPATEVVDKGPPARGYFVGTCSPYTTTFGCHARLGQGVAKAGPVDLSEPPGKLCAD